MLAHFTVFYVNIERICGFLRCQIRHIQKKLRDKFNSEKNHSVVREVEKFEFELTISGR